MNFRKTLLISMSLISFTFLQSCQEDSEPSNQEGRAQVRLSLTDAPGLYQAVYIDLQNIELKVDSSSWISLNTQAGIYNLLDFQNGLDTLIGQASVPAGKLNQIRLILGPNNSIVTATDSVSLKVPSGSQSGLKLLVNYTLQADLVYEFSLDFDAHRSIVLKGNGDYSLKPVIRVFTSSSTGSISGFIQPDSIMTGLLAHNTIGDSAATIADTTTGYFLLAGLNPGTYTVEFNPQAPFNFKDTTNIMVNAGQVTDLDTISL